MSQPVFDHVDVDTVVVPTIPARRLCGTDDVAAVALFLAGPGSEYLHGTRIALDGGVTA
jgi:NAD(P)-dependent dehydrogenase (short-subunit alcohol dehydrogenase family)